MPQLPDQPTPGKGGCLTMLLPKIKTLFILPIFELSMALITTFFLLLQDIKMILKVVIEYIINCFISWSEITVLD